MSITTWIKEVAQQEYNNDYWLFDNIVRGNFK